MNWYAAQPNEIFLDLDSRKALTRALKIVRVMPYPLSAVYYYPTGREGHSHLILVLRGDLDPRLKAETALWMGSDRLRACYVFCRIDVGLGDFADLLVTDRIYHRKPDATCLCCTGKHKDKKATDGCHALKMLLGSYRSFDFFPRAGRKHMEPLRVPVGRVPLTLIRRWRQQRAKK